MSGIKLLIGMVLLTFVFTSWTANKYAFKPIEQPKSFDTCFYFLSGKGLEEYGTSTLPIKAVNCKCSKDSIDIILNAVLKDYYPENYFMIESRIVNGPFKNITDAENAILKIRNVKTN